MNTKMNISPYTGPPLRFLLVDDNFIDNLVAEKLLAHYCPGSSFQIQLSARNALDYLKLHAQETQDLPDCLLLDTSLPVGSVRTVLEELVAMYPYLARPLVVITVGEYRDPALSQLMAANPWILGQVSKPLSASVLDTLQELCAQVQPELHRKLA